MSIANYFNKTCTIYKRTLGATNEYGERAWTETSSNISCALQPVTRLGEGYEITEAGKTVISTHIIYCATTVDITEGDKVVIDSSTFQVLLVSDDAGRAHHLKVHVKEVA